MTNPYDPNFQLYQGQALQGQPQYAQPQPQAATGLHFLEGVGNLALAAAHLFSGGTDDGEGEAEEAPRRRRRRFAAAVTAPKPAGSCCRAQRPKK